MRLNIVEVSASDQGGGAYQVAWNLYRGYADAGHDSWMVVTHKKSADARVITMSPQAGKTGWYRALNRLASALQNRRGMWRLSQPLRYLASPPATLARWCGHEYFGFPETYRVWERLPFQPDIIHMHNLHRDYFDLRALPYLNQRALLVMTLHDAWLMTGHCAHSFDCERWQTGCRRCPDLTIPPDLVRDGAAYNWRRKRDIYRQSRLFIATPSQWLMDKVPMSILREGMVESRVIPNGIDLSVFRPAPKAAAREALGLPQDRKIVLFVANGIRRNPWKDYRLMREAICLMRQASESLLFLALGEDTPPEVDGQTRIEFIPFQTDPVRVAQYYQAADVYLHAARVDTFPNVILEALACGLPVVATAVGGIPEQVNGLETAETSPMLNRHDPASATGILVPAGSADAVYRALNHLLSHEALREQLSENAIRDAQARFNLTLQVSRYLSWFAEIQARNAHP